jgi:N-acetylglucosaminyl-diphospho-decaprenol L-rhamnosyltransferase
VDRSGCIDVTVSIVHASKLELTLDCLSSLQEDSESRCSVEVVVLDNASGDGLALALGDKFPEVRVIDQHRRAGFGANQNTIIRSTNSRYVFVLNPDTRVPPGTLDGLVDYLDLHPKAGVVGPLVRGFDGVQQGSAWRLVSIPVQLVWALTLGKRGAVVSHGNRAKRVGAVAGSAMLLRRAAFEKAGLFDEAYFMFSEEAELARRYERLGFERHYLPTVEVLHLGQGSTAHVTERQINEFWRSFELYLSRYHSPHGARVLRWLTGLGYAFALGAVRFSAFLPARLAPAGLHSWNPLAYRRHVRNAYRGVQGPGLRELAEDWNNAQRRCESSLLPTTDRVKDRAPTAETVGETGQRGQQSTDAVTEPCGETAGED